LYLFQTFTDINVKGDKTMTHTVYFQSNDWPQSHLIEHKKIWLSFMLCLSQSNTPDVRMYSHKLVRILAVVKHLTGHQYVQMQC